VALLSFKCATNAFLVVTLKHNLVDLISNLGKNPKVGGRDAYLRVFNDYSIGESNLFRVDQM
jgi:hypothetical protein